MNQLSSGHTETPSPQQPAWRRYLAPAIGAAVAGAVVGLMPVLTEPQAPTDPYEKAMYDAGSEILEMPEFEDRYGELDEEDAFELGQRLGAEAIGRLADAELTEWIAITRELMDGVATDTCADIVRGTIDSEDSIGAMRSLDIETVERYLAIVMMALRLELTDAPGPSPTTAEDAQRAWIALATGMGNERLAEISVVLSNPAEATDDEVCVATRDLFAGLAQIRATERGAIFRILNPQLEAAAPIL